MKSCAFLCLRVFERMAGICWSKLACLTDQSLNTLSDLLSNAERLSALISSILNDLSHKDRFPAAADDLRITDGALRPMS
jgi:hypothetical protein